MDFQINQVFEQTYPPEAAMWCNENNAFIKEVAPVNGNRCFKIVAVPAPTKQELEQQQLMQAKNERAEAVENITVEVDGMIFDGDETSQARMGLAVMTMSDEETNVWVLHDNTIAQVSKAQLLEACRLARIEQSALWTKPYL